MLRQGVLSVLIIFQADKNSVFFLGGWYSRGTQRYRKNTDTKSTSKCSLAKFAGDE